MVTVITRQQWGATHGTGGQIPEPLSHVVIHHSAGPLAYRDAAAEAAEMRSLERYHVKVNGWNGIGYSFVVFPSGRVHAGRGWGREGAHTPGHNRTALGICLAGNGEIEPASPQAWAAATALIEHGIRHGHLTSQPRVTGHRDHKATACPGTHNYARLQLLRGITAIGQPPAPGSAVQEENDMPLSDHDMDRLEGMMRRLLGEAVGPGQRTWPGTVAATLDGVHKVHNRVAALEAAVAELRGQVVAVPEVPGAPEARATRVMPPRP